jgi:hypothetical protein
MLQYSIAYVKGSKVTKHIIRYPQLFSKAIETKLEEGSKRDYLYTRKLEKQHLAYYNVKY